jgi:hypothetical protein
MPKNKSTHMRRVLVIGGSGFFGRLLIDDLLQRSNCELILGSRRRAHSDRFKTVLANLMDRSTIVRALEGIDVVICAAGPYQNMPLTLAELCLERGIHYIDLADDREFVRKVRALAQASQTKRATICTAWSTVSALSGVLAKIASAGIEPVHTIRIHMAPGNRGARHTATIASLLHSVGQRFTIWRDGKACEVRGWSLPIDFNFASPIGGRRGYLVDVPDHELFPDLFGAATVEFRAGSELSSLNSAVSVLAATRLNWVRWSGLYQKAASLFSSLGTDAGGIAVEVAGRTRRTAQIVAASRGERMAVMPASITAALLLTGQAQPGLLSHTDWINEEQLQSECEKRGFQLIVEAH